MGARSLVRACGEPLWTQLLADLRRRLAGQEFGADFPGELALAAEYAVSRHTVRQALGCLRAEGAVLGARGRPARVLPARGIDQRVDAIYSLFESIEGAGRDQRSVVRVLDVHTDGTVAAHLGLEMSSLLVHLERLRLADDEPLAVDRAWLPASVAAPLIDADFTHTSLYQQLANLCAITVTGGSERIRAAAPSPPERALLGIDEGVAVFAVERLGTAHGDPVEWRHTLVRGDRFALTTDFSSPAGYHLDRSVSRT